MWYITTFQPVSLVSLKLSTATSTGGKALLWPTPFSFKMALLDVIIKKEGVARGEAMWPLLRDGKVAIDGPSQIAVTNTFTRIMKPMKGKPQLDEESNLTRGMIKTIGFREYVQWQGEMRIAFWQEEGTNHQATKAEWQRWLTSIHYMGKRGGFVQASGACDILDAVDALPEAFTPVEKIGEHFPLDGTLQLMDDCSPELTFEQVNIYSAVKNVRIGKERLLNPVIIPYRVARSSRSYTLYQRLKL